ncbi:MAG: hypothetical protein K2X27_13575 [Candidatus Obscuribacterales bacterium]|nr:hypothetical protein [Candidatus Obscuribacterales bacterium]
MTFTYDSFLDNRDSNPEKQAIIKSWIKFEAEYPSEFACCSYLHEVLLREGLLKCDSCFKSDFNRQRALRTLSCKNCGKKQWLTAKTIFRGAKTVRPWLAALWLMSEGLALSSTGLERLTGIKQSSALNILRKIRLVISESMNTQGERRSSEMFSSIIIKRSRETPQREHPRMEITNTQKKMEEEQSPTRAEPLGAEIITSTPSELTNFLTEKEYLLQKKLGDEPLSFDTLLERTGLSPSQLSASLTILELSSLAVRLSGDRYIRKVDHEKHSKRLCSRNKIDQCILDFIDFVRQSFHGVSRKYLQHYIAAYWCKTDRLRWSLDKLLISCIRSGPVSYKELLNYVSAQDLCFSLSEYHEN